MAKWILSLVFVFGGLSTANAFTGFNNPLTNFEKLQTHFMDQVGPQQLPWTVGDQTNYNMNMGFVSGTVVMTVREETEKGFWVDQDMDLGFMGENKVEMLVDKKTGKVLRLIVNGEEKEPPAQEDTEVIEMKEDRITVPAGTYDCVYIKTKNNENNQTSEAWVNPRDIPVTGMLKSVSPGQLGEVVIELTSFHKE